MKIEFYTDQRLAKKDSIRNLFFVLFFLFVLSIRLWAQENEARELLNKAYEHNDIPGELVRILDSCIVPPDEQQAILRRFRASRARPSKCGEGGALAR